jgi:probable phosphoglycerate mutase
MGLFYLMRHAETEWNVENRLCGQFDIPLSEAGRRQAKRLAGRLKSIAFEGLYSSPLRRAMETANLISEVIGLEAIVDERLIELGYGKWEGKTLAEVEKDDPKTFRAWDADPGEVAPPGGESGLEALQRVVPFLNLLAARHRQGHVAVVFHKTVCRLAVCHVLGVPPSEYRRRLAMDNAALSIIQPRKDGWQLVTFNDTSHLSDSHQALTSGREEF